MPFNELVSSVYSQYQHEQNHAAEEARRKKESDQHEAIVKVGGWLKDALGPVLDDLLAEPHGLTIAWYDPTNRVSVEFNDPASGRYALIPGGMEDAVRWTIVTPVKQLVDKRFDGQDVPSHRLATTIALVMALCREQKKINDAREQKQADEQAELDRRMQEAKKRDDEERAFLAKQEDEKVAARRAATIYAREKLAALIPQQRWEWPDGFAVGIHRTTLYMDGDATIVYYSIDVGPELSDERTLWFVKNLKTGNVVSWPVYQKFTTEQIVCVTTGDLPGELKLDEMVKLDDYAHPEGWGDWFHEEDQEWERWDGHTSWVKTGRKVPCQQIKDAADAYRKTRDDDEAD